MFKPLIERFGQEPLDPQEVIDFRKARKEAKLTPLAVHLPYLPNLATNSPELREKSVRLLSEELTRAERLGADFLVAHPGHVPKGESRESAIMRVAQSVVEVLSAQANDLNVTLLLENTSGQQAELGASLSELAQNIAWSSRWCLPGYRPCLGRGI
ncbi:MAG: TIM barrel protein [Deltaproteobacteria bacterium]|nr:TIM barrel protein [Deltaproteobacteria bacterium]